MKRKKPDRAQRPADNRPERSSRRQRDVPLETQRQETPRNPAFDRLMRIERRKARSRAIGLSIFVLAIMLITVLLIIAVMQQAKPEPHLMFIQNGKIIHTILAKGLIVRDESVFNAPAAGLLKPLAAEGSRAAKGQKLALIIPPDREQDLQELQKCEKDIVDLQTELMNSGKGAGAQAIFDESTAALKTVMNLVSGDAARGDLSNLGAYATSIDIILEQRTTRLMAIDFKDARLDSLLATRQSLEESLGLASGTMTCQKPGLISFRLDGLETILNLNAALRLNSVDYLSYIAQDPAVSQANKTVDAEQPVLRVASSLYQDLVFLLPEVDAGKFRMDSFTSIQIPADGAIIENCQVIRSEPVDSSALVIFKTDRKVELLANRRTFEAELKLSETSGLKVPVSALIDYEPSKGGASLMVVSGGYTQTCRVTVVDADHDYAIIEAVKTEAIQPKVSTIIVANPQSIEAGEFIGN